MGRDSWQDPWVISKSWSERREVWGSCQYSKVRWILMIKIIPVFFVDCTTRSKQWAQSNLTTCNFDILQDLSLPAPASIQWRAPSREQRVIQSKFWCWYDGGTAGGDIPSQSQHCIIVAQDNCQHIHHPLHSLSTVSPLSQIIKFKPRAELSAVALGCSPSIVLYAMLCISFQLFCSWSLICIDYRGRDQGPLLSSPW